MKKASMRALEIAAELLEARRAVERLEAELDDLVGGAEQVDGLAPKTSTAEAEPAAAPNPQRQTGRQGSPGRDLEARPGKAKRGARMAEVAALSKQGRSVNDIAGELGISYGAAKLALMRAGKAGLLPKAWARR